MSDKLTVSGLGTIDGTYEFDLAELLGDLTNRDLHTIKRMAGVRAGELRDSLAAGDNDVMVALAAILLGRAGRHVNEELLWDAPIEAGLVWSGPSFKEADKRPKEADKRPPAEPAATPEPEPKSSSGDSGPSDSENKANGQNPTGSHASVKFSVSDPATSVT